MLRPRDSWSDYPPEPRTRDDNYPTILFSWWCTGFATVIILVRVCGRKIRAGRIFSEDKMMLYSLIPLLIRMALVHVILLFGTNNVNTEGITTQQIRSREIGSRLVLASRIFYAMFIWISKLTVSEFLKRLARASWKSSYQRGLDFIRIFLLATFVAVVIATLAECQPFTHYWQVVPDPGPRCRQGYAQLIIMGAADIITDILLVCWPIPIIIQSHMPLKRKLSLVALFSLSLGLIAITANRVPAVISFRGRQQYRTVWASAEILASAAVANAVVLGSFVRDRGIKRNKYKHGGTIDSIERVSTRRPTLAPTDSDEDLFRSIGCRVPAELASPSQPVVRPAPVALSSNDYFMSGASPTSPLTTANTGIDQSGTGNPESPLSLSEKQASGIHNSVGANLGSVDPFTPPPAPMRALSFWDIGGLLEDGPQPSLSTTKTNTTTQTLSSSAAITSGVIAHDFAATATAPLNSPYQQQQQQKESPSRRVSSKRSIFGGLGERLSPSGIGRKRHFSQQRQPVVRDMAEVEAEAEGVETGVCGNGGETRQRSTQSPNTPEERDFGGWDATTTTPSMDVSPGLTSGNTPRPSIQRTMGGGSDGDDDDGQQRGRSRGPTHHLASLQDVGGLLR